MSQRDVFVAAMLDHVGWNYRVGPTRCTGEQHYHDCSGLISYGLKACGARPAGYCSSSFTFADDINAAHTNMTREEARATKGALAIRPRNNSIIPGVGHIVCSLGDGRTIEAHSSASGVIVGRFDGNRQFATFGAPPGVEGFGTAAAPVVIAAGVNVGWIIAAHPNKPGYWCVDQAGHVYCYGACQYFGGQGAKTPSGKVVKLNGACTGFSPTASGNGYLMITTPGSVYAFGDAQRPGDPAGDPND